MEIPWERLEEVTLTRVIEEFITREGTDYGTEYSLTHKVQQIKQALRRKEAVLLFDPESESCHIRLKAQLATLLSSPPPRANGGNAEQQLYPLD